MSISSLSGEARLLGEWRVSSYKVTLFGSKKASLWAIVEDKFGQITQLSSEQIHGGIHQKMSHTKLIRAIDRLPHKNLVLSLQTSPNHALELNIFLKLQAAGLDEDLIEIAKKLKATFNNKLQHQSQALSY